jgi:hypothetical protein
MVHWIRCADIWLFWRIPASDESGYFGEFQLPKKCLQTFSGIQLRWKRVLYNLRPYKASLY